VNRIRRMASALLIVSLALAGCASSKKAQEPQGALARIVERGVIRVGMTGEQPPLTMISRDGEFLGLDVAPRDVDVVMSGMTITPARVERVAFVGPYFTSGKTLLTRTAELAAIEIAEDLNRPELRFAALAGSTSEDFARRMLPNSTIKTPDLLDEAVQLLLSGKVDALVADRETCSFAALRHPGEGLITSSATFTLEPMGIAVPLDQPHLASLIQSYLTALDERGAIEKAKAFWFKDPSWVDNLR